MMYFGEPESLSKENRERYEAYEKRIQPLIEAVAGLRMSYADALDALKYVQAMLNSKMRQEKVQSQ